jgi:hypothetical protein
MLEKCRVMLEGDVEVRKSVVEAPASEELPTVVGVWTG